MTQDLVVIWALISVIIGQTIFYTLQIHKLLNKLMSRNYFDYEQSLKAQEIKIKLPAPDDVPEDLRVLQGFELS